MHTNVLGAMQVIPQVLPWVENAGGVFGVLSSSMSQIGSVPASNAWLYRVSKAALNMALASARFDYPEARLVALDPGWVQTDMGGAAAPLTLEAKCRWAAPGIEQRHRPKTTADSSTLMVAARPTGDLPFFEETYTCC